MTVGLRLEPKFRPAQQYLEALEGWATAGAAPGLQAHVDAFSLRLTSGNGYTCAIDHQHIVVSFAYPEQRKQEPGSLPGLEYSPIRTYQELLDQVLEHLAAVLSAALPGGPRGLLRIGLVADCHLAEDTAPPGLTRLIQHIGSPWDGNLLATKAHIVAVVEESEKHVDRCHHRIDVDRLERQNDLRLALDWQRFYSEAERLDADEMAGRVAAVTPLALEYFDRFAAGDLSYAASS